MRTNIVINDTLMQEAMTISGITTKKEVVEESLRLFVKLKQQKAIKNWFGKLRWEGDLEEMRRD